MMQNPIYLDNNATTLIDPLVIQAMQVGYKAPYNPSSFHTFGKKGKMLLEEARETIASYLGVEKQTLFFTCGGTASMNALIQGLLPPSGTILTTEVEHSCIYNPLKCFKSQSHLSVKYVPVDQKGAPTLVNIQALEALKPTLMVFSAVYSETGVMLPLEDIANYAEAKNIPLIIDGVALLGKRSFKIPSGVSAMAFSSHKIHGPKGVGLIYVKDPACFKHTFFGGGQESGVFPGTENLEGILGFSKAVELLNEKLPEADEHMKKLRNHFENTLLKSIEGVEINGEGVRICNTSNLAFLGLDAESLLFSLDRAGIYASLGSACQSLALEPSRALLKMGYSTKRALSSIRFSLSRYTTKEEIDHACSVIKDLVNKQKSFLKRL